MALLWKVRLAPIWEVPPLRKTIAGLAFVPLENIWSSPLTFKLPAIVVVEAAPLAILTSTSSAVPLSAVMVIPFLKVPSLATDIAICPASSPWSASTTVPTILA